METEQNPYSVAAYRSRAQLCEFVARDIAQQGAKATTLQRQKLEVAAAKRRERPQTTPTAGEKSTSSPLRTS
ncbi:hypothetical protein MRX96_015764 [Rhipicephalus microplus]